jgi:hypothetical protein
MKRLAVLLLAAGLALTGCRQHRGIEPDPVAVPEPGSPLDAGQLATAIQAARSTLNKDDRITSATYTIRLVPPHGTNTGHPCTSDRVVRMQLIGSFPHTTVTGHPVPPGQPMPDFTVGGALVFADVGSVQPCLVGAQTLERGPLHPRMHSWTLYEP